MKSEATTTEPPAEWTLTAHACRHCGGRVMQSGLHFVCATCESRCTRVASGICGCGLFPGARPKGSERGLFTCIENPTRGPPSPAAIVVRFGTV